MRLSRAVTLQLEGAPSHGNREFQPNLDLAHRSDERRWNMMKRVRVQLVILLLAAIAASMSASEALALDKGQLNRDARRALKNLYANNTAAKLLGKQAKAV